VFASVYGSIQLLPPKHRKLIKGILINKFRGDESLFDDGKKIIEKLTGVPVIGMIPYFRDIFIEQEDAVVLDHTNNKARNGKINIGVVLLKHIANFTDFDTLQHIPEVNLFYAKTSGDIELADILIIPGSKNTIDDMQYLHKSTIAKAIVQHHNQKKPLYGICGGYQIMGTEISDPHGIEGSTTKIKGLDILPVYTVLNQNKKTEQCEFSFLTDESIKGKGYEIHMGNTSGNKPLCKLSTGKSDGYFLNNYTWGTYIHGIFDNSSVIESILKHINPNIKVTLSYRDIKEKGYNQLASLVRKNIDIDNIYNILKQK